MWTRFLLPLSFLLSAQASASPCRHALGSQSSLRDFYSVLERLDLLPEIDTLHNVTILAMNNNAVVKLREWGLDLTKIDAGIARSIIRYHILEGIITSSNFPIDAAKPLLPHSMLVPPALTNVTPGAAVKLWKSQQAGSFNAESGLKKISSLVDRDIPCDTGIIHSINSNLVLPHNLSETMRTGSGQGFKALVERSEMTDELESLSDVTFLIPSQGAVRDQSTVLDSLSSTQLARVVANHVIPGRVLYHDSFTKGKADEWLSISGMRVQIQRDSDGRAVVNRKIRVLQEDTLVFGGVAHIIDDVIMDVEVGNEVHFDLL